MVQRAMQRKQGKEEEKYVQANGYRVGGAVGRMPVRLSERKGASHDEMRLGVHPSSLRAQSVWSIGRPDRSRMAVDVSNRGCRTDCRTAVWQKDQKKVNGRSAVGRTRKRLVELRAVGLVRWAKNVRRQAIATACHIVQGPGWGCDARNPAIGRLDTAAHSCIARALYGATSLHLACVPTTSHADPTEARRAPRRYRADRVERPIVAWHGGRANKVSSAPPLSKPRLETLRLIFPG